MNNFIDMPVIESFLRNGEPLHKMTKLSVTVKEEAFRK